MLILLGLVGMSYSSSVNTRVNAFRSSRGHVEALWAARAGIERARLVLSEAELDRLAADDPLFDDTEAFANQPVGPAAFSLIVPRFDPDQRPLFGLVDENARVNLNSVGEEFLSGLPGMSESMVDSLLDWRDADSVARPSGAEDAYYEELENPYVARNGALISVRELMRVRSWEPMLRLVLPDPYQRFLEEGGLQVSNLKVEDARLLMNMVTVWSADDNIAPDGEARLDLSSANAEEMRRRIENLTEDEANAIVKWRDGNAYASATDLLDVTKPEEENNNNNNDNNNNRNNRGGNDDGNRQERNASQGGDGDDRGNENRESNNRQGGNRARSGGSSSGEKVFSLDRVGEIIDYFSVPADAGENTDGAANGNQRPARINLNTAPRELLVCIPGISAALADTLLNDRRANPFEGAGALAGVDGVGAEIFRKIYPVLTARSSRFHVWSRGIEPDSGASVTVEAVLSADSGGNVSIVYWREN